MNTEQAITGLANFFVFAKKFEYKVRKSRVRVVIDNADTEIQP